MIYAISGIITICAAILVHELGHFLVSKILGIKVIRFSVGIGKPFLTKTINGTEYCLAPIPLGGYVSIEGFGVSNDIHERHKVPLVIIPRWKKVLIVLSGPLANLIFAAILFSIIAWSGIPVSTPVVGSVSPGSPASDYGLKPGDKIFAVNNNQVAYWNDALKQVAKTPEGKPVRLSILRSGIRSDLEIPAYLPKFKSFRSYLGNVRLGAEPGKETAIRKAPFGEGLLFGAVAAGFMTFKSIEIVFKMFTGKERLDSLGGPVSIFSESGKAANQGIYQFILLMAVLNVGMTIFNLIPLPVLDGGQLLILGIEGLIRRPVPVMARLYLSLSSWVLIIALFVFLIIKDTIGLFQN